MKQVIKYLVTIIIGLIMAFSVCKSKYLFVQTNPLRIYRILCDAFFVSGTILSSVGLLVFVSKEGLFDGMTYYAGRLRLLLSKDYEEKRKNALSYYEYKQAKNRDGGQVGFILVVGLGFLAVAGIFLALFYYYF